jgi:hypothetical protein
VATGQEGSIAQSAFSSCTKLKEVVFGDSAVTILNTIGVYAF